MHALDYYGDRFKWFVGVVKELSADGTKVRVRVFGVHHMDDVTNVSDGDLPWAVVLKPTTSNTDAIVLADGDWVMGFFADNDDCMLPVVVGVIGGGLNSEATSSGVGTENGGGDSGGGDGDAGGSGPTPSTNVTPEDLAVPGNSNEQKTYNYMRATWEKIHGDSELAHIQTVGIMGHIRVESSFVLTQPNRLEGAYGFCQWRGARLTKLFQWSGIRPGSGKGPGLTQQVSFIFHELETTHTTAYGKLMGARNVEQAVTAFSFFEQHAGVNTRAGRINWRLAKKVGCSPENGKKVCGAAWNQRLAAAREFDAKYKNSFTRPGSTETIPPNTVESGVDSSAVDIYQGRD